jgi:nitronate monooxygenase
MLAVPLQPDPFAMHSLVSRLKVPLVAAPMFLVSSPELVIAAARAGIVGAFPTLNARTPGDLETWLTRIMAATAGAGGLPAANLILHKSNPRRDGDLRAVLAHRVPLVIASVGAPDEVIGPVHAYGGLVMADVATVRHARRAAQAGVDGLVLLTAGAGGNTGWLNPFAFVAEVRRFFDGPIAVAGGLTDGRQLHALQVAGADLGYVGTPFIATHESLADDAYREGIVAAHADDILTTAAVTGIPANFVRANLREQGLVDERDRPLQPQAALEVGGWRRAWSAGHGVGGVDRVASVAERVADLAAQYEASRAAARGGSR